MSKNITFICGDMRRDIIFEGKRTVFDLLSQTEFDGVNFDFPCGGKKTCRKCKVKLIHGFEFISEPDETEKKYLSDDEIKENIRYACMCEVFGDVAVELNPDFSGFFSDKIEVQTEGLKSKGITPNKFKKITVILSEPTLGNPISAEKNLMMGLNLVGATLRGRPPFNVIKKLSEINSREIDVILSDKIIDVRKSGECNDIYGAAVDIGTTTAAVYLYSLINGTCIGVAAEENPQRIHGADVITRINYTIENADGLNDLQCLILSRIFQLIKDLCNENNINSSDVYSVVLTGNTVMQHIAAGFSPKNIAFTPFTAATLFGFEITQKELLFYSQNINPNAIIYFPPAFASYVGGDIATGIIASDTDLCDNLRLFLDIGTNGEIGLGNKDSLVFCATAAGPAFEGAHIKLGMAGVKGAINNIYLDQSNQIICETIGNIVPKGICGSGIIDAVAVMLELGVLNEKGRIKSDCEIDGERVFMLDTVNNIYITQNDIQEIQLAKAAISAGIITLLYYAGKSFSDVGELILAGGFGAHINKKSACKIGLIPIELEDKIIVAGNTAGMGAAAVLLDNSAVERISKVAGTAKYIELSGDDFFMDEYVERMMF